MGFERSRTGRETCEGATDFAGSSFDGGTVSGSSVSGFGVGATAAALGAGFDGGGLLTFAAGSVNLGGASTTNHAPRLAEATVTPASAIRNQLKRGNDRELDSAP